jgi:hypothetical protein
MHSEACILISASEKPGVFPGVATFLEGLCILYTPSLLCRHAVELYRVVLPL